MSDIAEVSVSVCMITYNHEKFVAQAIEGVLMQKTSFTFELIIGEDYSKDNTRTVCLNFQKRFPDVIKLQLSDKNRGASSNFLNSLQMCTGKYVALCEGDDFWTDPFKLQKQMDFLESNPDFILCGTDAQHYIEQTGMFAKLTLLGGSKEKVFSQVDIAAKNRMVTATVMFRNHPVLAKIPQSFVGCPYGDWMLFVLLTQFGKARNLDFVSAVYRNHSEGAYSGAAGERNNYNHVILYKMFLTEFNLRSKELLNNYLKFVFWVYSETMDRGVKKKMIVSYMVPFRVTVFFDRFFLSMVKRYYFNKL